MNRTDEPEFMIAVNDGESERRGEPDAQEICEPSIDSLVGHVVIRTDGLMENLPAFTESELKLIGRHVSFCALTSVNSPEEEGGLMYYEGVVSLVTKDTVVLLHAQRYTGEDMRQRRALLNHAGCPAHVAGDANPLTSRPNSSEEESQGHASTSPNSPLPFGGASDDPSTWQPLHLHPTASSETPDVASNDHETHTKLRDRLGKSMQSLGPIPFVTFSRSRIHQVVFAPDRPRAVYSIFSDPSRRLFDMQCLRMFVRRYIVHCSEDNNPQNITLREFIEKRSSSPNVEDALLKQIAHEEICHLVKIEQTMKRAQRRKIRERRNAMNRYRAPRGLFQHTGLMFTSGIPRFTFYVGLLQLLFTCVMVIFTVMTFVARNDAPIINYLTVLHKMIVGCACVWGVSALCTLFHSVRMRVPVASKKKRFAIAGYCGLLIVGAAGALMLIIASSIHLREDRFRTYLYKHANSLQLCTFYYAHSCSGFDVACGLLPIGPLCPSSCNDTFSDSGASLASCRSAMISGVQGVVIPVAMLSMVMLGVIAACAYALIKAISTSHAILREMDQLMRE